MGSEMFVLNASPWHGVYLIEEITPPPLKLAPNVLFQEKSPFFPK